MTSKPISIEVTQIFPWGQYESAIEDYENAISLNPNYANAYNNRGNVRLMLNQYAAAIMDFDKSINLNSDYAEAYANRGAAKVGLDDIKGAKVDFHIALETRRTGRALVILNLIWSAKSRT